MLPLTHLSFTTWGEAALLIQAVAVALGVLVLTALVVWLMIAAWREGRTP